MIGKRYAQKMLPLLGQKKEIDFDTSTSEFPIVKGMFNPSLYLQGTFTATKVVGTFSGTFGGWRYSKGIDFSEHRYLVVQLSRKAACSPVLKIFDEDDYLSPCFSYAIGSDKEAVIDLQSLVKEDGTSLNLSKIYMLGFGTDASAPLYIKNVYLSDDGTTPSAIQSLSVSADVENQQSWFDLFGRRVTAPSRGIYIRGGKKVLFQ